MKSITFSGLLTVVGFGALGAACADSPLRQKGEETATVASALLSDAGLYPYPVTMENATTPLPGANGKPTTWWPGTITQLITADAWAQCVANNVSDLVETDPYLKYVDSFLALDNWSYCPTSATDPLSAWKDRRANPSCNANTSSGTSEAVTFVKRNTGNYTFNWPSTLPGPPAYPALYNAWTQLSIADVDLCIGQYVREQMVEAPGLLFAEPDVAEALEVVRERSQVAMLQYSLLGIAFTSADNRIPASYATNQIPPILRAFANAPENASALPQIGRDYAAAIQLHTQTTTELAGLLARNASARLPMPSGLTGAALDWGPGGWRDRAFRLLYGGDPLYGTSGTQLWPSPGFVGTPWVTPPRLLHPLYFENPYIDQDARTPEVDELLSYARMADALYFRSGIDGGPAPAVAGEIDVEASAQQLYRSVEASFRHPSCIPTGGTAPATTCDALAWGTDIPDPTASQSSDLLWQKRKITLDHARALVARLGQAMPKYHTRGMMNGGNYEREGVMHFTGPLSYVNTTTNTTALPSAVAGLWYHLPPTTQMTPMTLADRAGLDNFSQVYIPLAIDMTNLGLTQGFTALFNGTVSGEALDGQAQMRTLGSIPALAATRDALFTITGPLASTSATAVARFAAAAGQAIPLVDAAIGTRSVGLRPELQATEVYDACTEWGNTSGSEWCQQMTQRQMGQNALNAWDLTLVTKAGDPYTSLVIVPSSLSTGLTVSAANDPTFVSYLGNSMASLVAGQGAMQVTGTDQPGPNGTIRRIFSFGGQAGGVDYYLSIPAANGQPATYQRIFAAPALKTPFFDEPENGNPATNLLLWKSVEGRWFAGGGSLGAMAQRLWATQAENWSKPGFDGFGYPTNMFQVTDPNLSTTDAVAYWIGEASKAAAAVQTNVTTAIQNVLQEQANAATVQGAQQNAQQLDSAAEQGFCGTNNTTCDADVQGTAVVLLANLKVSHLLSYPDCSQVDTNAYALCMQYQSTLMKLVPSVVYLPSAVAAQSNSPSAPSFSNYTGGSLQGLLTTTWGALSSLQRASVDGSFALQSRFAAAAAANIALQASNANSQLACSNDSMQSAANGGFSYGLPTGGQTMGTLDLNGAGSSATIYNVQNESWSPGPLMAQIQACEQAQIGLAPSRAQLAASWADAWSTASNQLSAIESAFAALQTANAAVSKAAADATRAVAEANLQAQITASTQTTSFGAYRRFYSLDMFNAQAALDEARLYAVYARRAIEAHYVVDLSTMTANEAFVAAPSTWADSIYASDLDMVTPVGLSIPPTPTGTPAPINANVLTNYVNNLQNFVNGYLNAPSSSGITRAVTPVPSDVDLFEIAGPDARTTITDTNGNPVSVLSPQAMAWSFYCAGSGTTPGSWITNPAATESPAPSRQNVPSQLMTACNGAAPTTARLTFSVDGWGRLNGDEAQDPSAYLFNARWNRLAVNLAGTGVEACTILPGTGTGCSPNNNYVYYNLTSLGPAWETDFNQTWHVLGAPIGRMSEAKAAAVDGVVWSTTFAFGNVDVEPFVRTDFVQRPLAGTYQLDLLVGAGANLSAIDYVQILRDVSYWEIQGQ